MMNTKVLVMLLALIMLSTAADVQAYNVYYGQLHSHTSYSDGSGIPEEAYAYARDTAGLDFFSIADHCSYPYDPCGAPYGDDGLTVAEYEDVKSVAGSYNEDGVFTAFWGFEWTSDSQDWGGPETLLARGHITVINSPYHCEADEEPTNTLNGLVEWMSTRDCVAFFNHPGEYGYTFTDIEGGDPFEFDYTDKIVGMELWNRNDDFYNYFDTPGDWYHKAIDNGWYIGASGSQDNHSADWGTYNEWRMAILADALTRADLLDAMKARRFYSSRDKNLVLSFTCNGEEMGSRIEGGDLSVVINASDDEASDEDEEFFSKIELLKNGTVIKTWDEDDFADSTNPNVSTEVTGGQDDYFYVIVYQVAKGKDKWEAISSPIFVTSGEPAVDIVTVTKAEYSIKKSELKVEATSTASGSETLNVDGYGDMTYKANKDTYSYSSGKGAADPGTTVTVTSTGGGEDTITVTRK